MQIAGINSNWVLRIETQAAIASAMIKQGVVHKGARLFAHVTHDCNDSKPAVSPDQLSSILSRLLPNIEARLFWMVHCSGEKNSAGFDPSFPLMPPLQARYLFR
jgi:hypothetical protein